MAKTSPAYEIQRIREEWTESLREAVGSVARERRFLNTLEAFSLEDTRAFVRMILDGGGVQFVALDGERVVGWCDVVRNSNEGNRHCGVLGMGVVRDYRPAIRLYERTGFSHEGRKVRARILDGTDTDFLMMARFLS